MEDVSYIKLFRKLTKWEWYTEPNTFKLFIHILIKANYVDKKWRGIVIKRGSFITSKQKLSAETGLSIRSIRTALRNLEKTKEIEVKATNKNTLIKALKYDFYQGCDVVGDKQNDNQTTNEMTIKRQSNDNQTTTTNKYKNIKNIKNILNQDELLDSWNEEEQFEPINEDKLNEFEKMLEGLD